MKIPSSEEQIISGIIPDQVVVTRPDDKDNLINIDMESANHIRYVMFRLKKVFSDPEF